MKRLLIILFLFISFSNLVASDYIESMDYLKVSSLSDINDLVKGEEEDYKAFYLLDEKIKNATNLEEEALILKGWLAYRYSRYSEAIEAWQAVLDLKEEAYHSWVNLWLSWVYLREGNILGALDAFKYIRRVDLRDSQDENLYLTIKNRLTYFPLPIKEDPKLYLDFVSFIEPYERGVFLGNVYGGVVYLDMLGSGLSIIEKPIPSMKGNPVTSLIYSKKEEAPNGFFYANREGIFFISYERGEKKKLPSLPIKESKSNKLANSILFNGNLISHFSEEGLWIYYTSENRWELITKDIKVNSFLEAIASSHFFFLNKESKLNSILWSDDSLSLSLSIEDLILEENYFNPIQINSNEFWLATDSGNLYRITFSMEEPLGNFNVICMREGEEEERWLSIWRGEKSGLFNIIDEKGLWKRIDSKGNLVNLSNFVIPILSNLIHYYGVGEDYIYLNIASEVYAVNEELFFNQ